jgi:hypothetical protein
VSPIRRNIRICSKTRAAAPHNIRVAHRLMTKERSASIYWEPLSGFLNRPPRRCAAPLLTQEGSQLAKILSKEQEIATLLHKKHKSALAFCG